LCRNLREFKDGSRCLPDFLKWEDQGEVKAKRRLSNPLKVFAVVTDFEAHAFLEAKSGREVVDGREE